MPLDGPVSLEQPIRVGEFVKGGCFMQLAPLRAIDRPARGVHDVCKSSCLTAARTSEKEAIKTIAVISSASRRGEQADKVHKVHMYQFPDLLHHRGAVWV